MPESQIDLTRERTERRYLALQNLAADLVAASDWDQLAASLSRNLSDDTRVIPVRIWVLLPDGPEELAKTPNGYSFPSLNPSDLRKALTVGSATAHKHMLVPLTSSGGPAMVLEVAADEAVDAELLTDAAPIVASRASGIAAQSIGAMAGSSGQSQKMLSALRTFARTAKATLDHDRFSVYILTPDGRAAERIASDPVVPGEGTIIPFAEFGLRHIMLTNQALVSDELGSDSRVVAREDRLIAGAGFKGLLSLPLRLDGKPYGVFNFVSRTAGFYRTEDMPIGQQIADQISIFVYHLHREQSADLWTRRQAVQRERQRLAASLHGDLAQTLPDVANEIQALADEPLEPARKQRAEAVAERVNKSLASVRRAVAGAVPAALDSSSLIEVIKDELDAMEREHQVSAQLIVDGDDSQVSKRVQHGVYSVLQEALGNVAHHARAQNVIVRIDIADGLKLSVTDDGAGCDAEEAHRGQTLGMSLMREEAQLMGGIVELDSSVSNGTTLSLQVPSVGETPESYSQPPPTADTPSGVSVRILIAERRPLMRAGIAQVLSAVPDLRVVGTAADPDELRSNTRRLRPDVVLLDVHLGQNDVMSLSDEIRRASPTTFVIAMSEDAQLTWQDLTSAGASGVLRKEMGPGELVAAIKAVASGATLMNTQVNPEVRAVREQVELTSREVMILALLASGKTNSEIADTLCLASKTIERHVSTIVKKVGARNRTHAAALAIEKRMVELPRLGAENQRLDSNGASPAVPTSR